MSLSQSKEELNTIIQHADQKLINILLAVSKEYTKEDITQKAEKGSESDQLYRLVYTSARNKNCSEEDIEEILKASQRNNKPLNVTGMLIHTNDRFLQVLEGSKNNVMSLYEKINKDKRHGGSIMRFCQPVDKRHFGDWNMAGKKLNSQEVEFNTSITDENKKLYKSMLNGDIHSYKDEGMRVLKIFLAFS